MGKGKKKHAAASGADEQINEAPSNQNTPQDNQAPAEEQRPAKKARSAIDDIFAKAKPTAAAATDAATKDSIHADGSSKSEAKPEAVKPGAQGKKTKVEGSKDDIFGDEAQQARKRTEEGFRVFSEDELGLNKKGGFTDDCPFDCDCCF